MHAGEVQRDAGRCREVHAERCRLSERCREVRERGVAVAHLGPASIWPCHAMAMPGKAPWTRDQGCSTIMLLAILFISQS